MFSGIHNYDSFRINMVLLVLMHIRVRNKNNGILLTAVPVYGSD